MKIQSRVIHERLRTQFSAGSNTTDQLFLLVKETTAQFISRHYCLKTAAEELVKTDYCLSDLDITGPFCLMLQHQLEEYFEVEITGSLNEGSRISGISSQFVKALMQRKSEI